MGVGVGTKSAHGYGYKILPTGMGAGMSLHLLVLKIQRIPILVIIKLADVDSLVPYPTDAGRGTKSYLQV